MSDVTSLIGLVSPADATLDEAELTKRSNRATHKTSISKVLCPSCLVQLLSLTPSATAFTLYTRLQATKYSYNDAGRDDRFPPIYFFLQNDADE